jgi:hypothetical protein
VGDILKIEELNDVDGNPNKPLRRVLGYAIAAKRYALYTQTKKDISLVKASGHGLAYLFTPKKYQPLRTSPRQLRFNHKPSEKPIRMLVGTECGGSRRSHRGQRRLRIGYDARFVAFAGIRK